jgi:hypothetical protein
MDKRTISLILFIVGLILALTAGVLLFLGILPSSVSAIIGIIGIGLIAISHPRLLK